MQHHKPAQWGGPRKDTGRFFTGHGLLGGASPQAAGKPGISSQAGVFTPRPAPALAPAAKDLFTSSSALQPHSPEELLDLLDGQVKKSKALLRVPRARLSGAPAAAPAGSRSSRGLDAGPDHPLYGPAIAEWLEHHEPQPGRVLLGYFRDTLNELHAAISSKRQDKFMTQ